jgi:hypothetical protein
MAGPAAPHDEAATTHQPEKTRPIRARALILTLLLLPFVNYAATNQSISNVFSLMVAPVGALLILIVLNVPLRKLFPRVALSEPDLLVIFALLSVGASISSEWAWVNHSTQHAFPLISPVNPTVREHLMPNMPDWLVIKDLEAVKDMQGGGRGFGYVLQRFPTFLPYYLAWGAIFCLIAFAMLCINSLMRNAWCKTERLAFPLIQLPVAMSENGGKGGMWKSRHMWIAFAVMFSIDILNGLNYLYPNVPSIPVRELVDIRSLFQEPPLSNMGYFPIAIFPFMAAIGLLMPSNLLFSLVLFFLLRKATHVAIAAYGIPQNTFSGTAISPGPPYFDEQTWGGIFALFLGALWVSRGYLRSVWKDIITGAPNTEGGLKHRWAFGGLILCFAGVVWVGTQGDLPVHYMIVYFGVTLVFSIVLTRLRAQIGPPTHEFAFFGPNSVMFRFFGTNWITDKQGTFLSQVFLTINRIHRTHPMPYQLEAMKITTDRKINQRQLFLWIMVITAVAFILGYFFLHVYTYRTNQPYRWGDGESYFRNIQNNRHGPDILGITMTIFGFAMVMLMDAIRFRFPAFPVHPAGYVLSMNFGIDYYWFGLLLALITKNFVQHYYGLRGYDKLRNVAFGILVGEYAAETIWMSMALITNQSTYTISFNDRSLGIQ